MEWKELRDHFIISGSQKLLYHLCLRQTPWKIKSRPREEIFFPFTESSLFNFQRVGSDLWVKEQCDWLLGLSAASVRSPERVILRSNTSRWLQHHRWEDSELELQNPAILLLDFLFPNKGPCSFVCLSHGPAVQQQPRHRAGGSLSGCRELCFIISVTNMCCFARNDV